MTHEDWQPTGLRGGSSATLVMAVMGRWSVREATVGSWGRLLGGPLCPCRDSGLSDGEKRRWKSILLL